jgi:hypothetical protein
MFGRPPADQTQYFPAGAALGKKKEEEAKLQNLEPPSTTRCQLQTCLGESRQKGLDAKGVTPE